MLLRFDLRSLLCSLLIAVAVATSTAAAPPAISLDIRIKSGVAPASFIATITVAPHPDNRWLCVLWTQIQGGQQERTSCLPWEGLTAPITHTQWLKELDSGKWDAVAYVARSDESSKLSNRITLHVFGPNYASDGTP